MTRVALVTAKAALGTDIDLAPLLDALAGRAIDADAPCWDDPSVVWGDYDLAVLRSPWDYVPRYEEFPAWLDATEAVLPVLNPASTVRWNTDKRYLDDLAERGVPVVPTQFCVPGEPMPALTADQELVVKPTISAGSRDTMRHSSAASAERHIRELLSAGRSVMVQAYQHAIDTFGETGLVYFVGELSHAFRKAPILALDVPPTDAFFAEEVITPRLPSESERQVADAAIAASGPQLLYGRVDLVPGADGQPQVLELELAEPSYFVAQSEGAADRFAAAVERRVASSG